MPHRNADHGVRLFFLSMLCLLAMLIAMTSYVRHG